MILALKCPVDRGQLAREGDRYRCAECRRTYRVSDNIVRFLDSPDEFYEGAYMNQLRFVPRSESWYAVWPLWLINSGYAWQVRRNVPSGSTVLELGCAGGVLYFAQRYRMAGLDVSLSALRSVSGVYDLCLHADAAAGIPLPDGSLDAITSSYFWEHIPVEAKERILAECRRVLRPGGKLIFLYDVETSNPLITRLRSGNERLYQKHFLQTDRHFGYHTAEDNRLLFEHAGFRVASHTPLERFVLQSPSVFEKMRFWPSAGARLVGRLGGLGNSRWLLGSYSLMIRVFDSTLGRLLPGSWGRIALSVCERP